MHAAPVLAVIATTIALAAQSPTLVPKDAVARLAVEDVPTLLAQLPQTALGKLLAEPEVTTAFALARKRQRQLTARRDGLWQQARALGVELEPWLQMNHSTAAPTDPLLDVELADLLRFEVTSSAPSAEDHSQSNALLMACTPRAEGRWTARFEQRAKRYAEDKFWRADPDSKFEGFATYQFVPAELSADDPSYEYVRGTRLWMMHLPGTFAYGSGKPERCAKIAPPPPGASASASMSLDMPAYMQMFVALGVGMPPEFSTLGIDTLHQLQWRMRFVGDRVLDELELQLSEVPRGLFDALLTGTAALPAQPLPDGALAQLRLAVDVKALVEMIKVVPDIGNMPEATAADLTNAVTGGIALSVTAPARGQVIPRIFLSIGIADEAALDRLLASLAAVGKTKQVTYEGVPCTVMTLPDLPAMMQPTWCKLDGVLHIAESSASMRAFLKSRPDGGDAMAVGDAPLPAGEGELLPFDLRCDEAAMYRTFHDVWLPLYSLAEAMLGSSALLQRDDMPSTEAVEKHLGSSRGVLRRQGNTYTVQHLGRLGGPEGAALAMTWGPIVSALTNQDYSEDQLATAVGRHQITRIWEALEKWKTDHGTLPTSLGELVAAGKLPAEALLVVPDDAAAEAIPLSGNPATGGDGKTIPSSFRYFPTAVEVDTGSGTAKVLLIAITPCRYNRAILADDGTTPDLWGSQSQQPIDKFGK